MRWVCMQSRRLHCFFKDLEKSQKLSCTVSCVFLLQSLTGPSAAWRNQSGHFLLWPFLELWDGLKFVRTWHTHRHAAHRQTNRREQRMLLAFSIGRWCWLVANLARARRSLRNLWCRTFPRHIVVKTPSLMSLVNLFRSWCRTTKCWEALGSSRNLQRRDSRGWKPLASLVVLCFLARRFAIRLCPCISIQFCVSRKQQQKRSKL